MTLPPKLRIALAITALACLALAALFQLRQVPPQGEARESRIDGGCATSSSPYLEQDATVFVAAITYCGQGDADTMDMSFELPADALKDNELVVAGYIDGEQVRLLIQSPSAVSALPLSLILNPKETWTSINSSIPETWHGDTLHVALSDSGTGHTQWAGIGIRGNQVHQRSWVLPLIGLSFFLLLTASLNTWRLTAAGTNNSSTFKHLSRRDLWRQGTIIAIATLIVLMFRRPDQFSAAYIWVEDGTISLPQYLAHGWLSIFDPVAGYLILPSKIIHIIAMSISASHYPEIANWLNVIFHIAILYAIAFSPTSLRYPLVCALATLAIPTDSEVFGTSHYAFWWGSLLLIPPLLWREDQDQRLWPRATMTIIGGLSSPLVIMFFPLFAIRGILRQETNGRIICGIALICATIQGWMLAGSGTHGTGIPENLNASLAIQKFLGMFVLNQSGTPAALQSYLGIFLVGLLAVGMIGAGKRLNWTHFVILSALGASIAISVMRAPLDVIHPVLAGPRYFFYPFVFLGWFILQLAPVTARHISAILVLCLGTASLQFLSFGPRKHEHLDWKHELSVCIASDDSNASRDIPVHFDGTATRWHVTLTAAECQRLRDRSLFQ